MTSWSGSLDLEPALTSPVGPQYSPRSRPHVPSLSHGQTSSKGPIWGLYIHI